MKFHWFHLMPWPDLPDDFQKKHRSVWVDVDYKLFDAERCNTVYNEYLDELECPPLALRSGESLGSTGPR